MIVSGRRQGKAGPGPEENDNNSSLKGREGG